MQKEGFLNPRTTLTVNFYILHMCLQILHHLLQEEIKYKPSYIKIFFSWTDQITKWENTPTNPKTWQFPGICLPPHIYVCISSLLKAKALKKQFKPKWVLHVPDCVIDKDSSDQLWDVWWDFTGERSCPPVLWLPLLESCFDTETLLLGGDWEKKRRNK